MTYLEKLKDKRWTSLAYDVKKEAGFKCRVCGHNKTLQAHHRMYKKNKEPWEYEMDDMVCLCGSCHEKFHFLQDEILLLINREAYGFFFAELEMMVHLIKTVKRLGSFKLVLLQGYINNLLEYTFDSDISGELLKAGGYKQ